MQDKPVLKERVGPDPLGAIDGLVRDDEIPRLDLLRERSRRGERDDAPHPDVAECGDIGPHGDLGGEEFVEGSVAGEESDGDGVAGGRGRVFEDGDGRRRGPPGRGDGEDGGFVEARESVQASAAYHADVYGGWGVVRKGEVERIRD